MGILPLEMQPVPLRLLPEQLQPLLHLLQWDLRLPLKRSMRFGDEGGTLTLMFELAFFLCPRAESLRERSMIPLKSSSSSVGSPS